MLDSIETVLLIILPWSFVAKSIALGVMWWTLSYRTTATGPLGQRIDISFRDQFVMSMFITWAMFILFLEVDASEVNWPFVTLSLLGLSLWPWRAAWSHYRVWRYYRHLAREKDAREGR